MRLLRLRYITTCDFRKSELKNYTELIAKKKGLSKLGPSDVVLLMSHGKDQLVFIHGFGVVNGTFGVRRFLHSERLRLDGGTWEPLMLANYAQMVDIKLEGLKTFEEHMKKIRTTVAKKMAGHPSRSVTKTAIEVVELNRAEALAFVAME